MRTEINPFQAPRESCEPHRNTSTTPATLRRYAVSLVVWFTITLSISVAFQLYVRRINSISIDDIFLGGSFAALATAVTFNYGSRFTAYLMPSIILSTCAICVINASPRLVYDGMEGFLENLTNILVIVMAVIWAAIICIPIAVVCALGHAMAQRSIQKDDSPPPCDR